jgi:hypothetical protein
MRHAEAVPRRRPHRPGRSSISSIGPAAALVAVVAVLVLRPRLFLRAVRRGKVRDVVLRASDPEDAMLPLVTLFGGPFGGATLERAVHCPTYRTTARQPLFRIGRRRITRGLALALGALGLVASATTLYLLFVFLHVLQVRYG